MIEQFEVTPISVDGFADANGVYVNRLGAWLGESNGYTVDVYIDENGDYIPAPEDWQSQIIRSL